MKLFKNTLAIVALFAIGSVGAKGLRKTGATPPVTQVTTTPLIQGATTANELMDKLLKESDVGMKHIEGYIKTNTNFLINSVNQSQLTDQEKNSVLDEILRTQKGRLQNVLQDLIKALDMVIDAL